MSGPLQSFDQPILLNSVATRDNLKVEAVPGEAGRKHDRSASPGRTPKTGRGSETSTAGESHSDPSDFSGPHSARQDPTDKSDSDPRSGLADSVIHDAPLLDVRPRTDVRAGQSQKLFVVVTELLISNSPYFASMQVTVDNPQPPHRLDGPFFFPEVDEFAFALFVHWIHGGTLHGPRDFHSLTHYLELYVLGFKFEIESLRNTVMDLVRSYYYRESMTAPAFRLEYIYNHTDEPCPMRLFLTTTAAYRYLVDTDRGLSESFKNVVKTGGDLVPDFLDATVRLSKNDREDVRKGDNCLWHEHLVTPKCKHWIGFEPFESA